MKLAGEVANVAFDVWVERHDEIVGRWGKGKELSITSLPTIDKKLWGLPKQKLCVIGARPSNGKSTFMLQIAWDLARAGKKVYFFSLEMSVKTCIDRLWCLDQSVDNFLLTTGKIGQMYDIASVRKQRDDFHNNLKAVDTNLIFFEEHGHTFAEINDTINNLPDADVVIIDYLQMVKGDKRQKDKEAIDEYIKQLRSYAKTKNFCAIVGSQINRGTHDTGKIKEPDLWELKGSGAIEEHSDMVILLHWENMYQRDKVVEEGESDFIVKVAKNRDGRVFRQKCMFEPRFYRVREVEDDKKPDTAPVQGHDYTKQGAFGYRD